MHRILRSVKLTTLATLLAILASTSYLQAQTKTVTGVVKSEKETLPGVTVVEKGTSNGTVSDVDGKFSLPVSDGATLVFSFIGMKSQEISVGSQSTIDITLESDATQLSDVVIVGYGTSERKDIMVPVSSISAKQIADIPINNTGQALAGRLAGVQIVTSEGSPNASVTVRVRGGGSITQNNTPLFIVDGIQVNDALNVIAPQDIQSIDVLKDASATAIYGARGANGVVIITTKGGREMKTQVSVNSMVGIRQLANKLDVMKPYDFVFYQYERAQGNATSMATFQKEYGNFSDLDLYKQVPFTDWQKEVFGRNALMTTNNVSLTGGTKDTQFNLSVSRNTEQGIMLNSDFDRKLINFRFEHRMSKYVRAGFNVRYNDTDLNGVGTSNTGSSSVNRLRQSVKYRPLLFPGQSANTYDPSYAQETNANSLSLINPVLLSAAEYQKNITSLANFNGYVVVDPTDYLSFRSTFGVDLTANRINVFNDTITSVSQLNGAKQPIASILTTNTSILNNSNVVTFSLHKLSPGFGTHNKLDVLLGHEILQQRVVTNYIESHLFPVGITADRALGNMALGTPQIPTSSDVSSRLLSFFGRASFSRDDKYFAAVTFRSDGSSKFADGKKWGTYPSASAAWRISSEGFMQSIKSSARLNDLKLRASFGIAGNNRIGDFLYLSQFTPSAYYDLNNTLVTGYNPLALSNNNLQWENTTSRDLGLDASFFENRLQLSVDVYRNTTEHLLLNTPVPTSSGYQTQLQNIGNTSNQGIEIQLSGTPLHKSDFIWNASFNISFNHNNIESLGAQSSFLFQSGWAGGNAPFDYTVAKGRSVGSIWGLVTDGFYKIDDFNYNAATSTYTLKAGVPTDQGITAIVPKPGVLKFKDLNGDGIVDDNDRTIIGNTTPKFFGGFNNQFRYKNFDMSVYVNFQYGNQVLNANKLEFTSGYTPNANLLSIMNNRFRNVDANGAVVTDPTALAALNVNATIWSPLLSASSFYVHSWAVEDGSFLRINNVTLGYSLPQSLLSKIRLTRLRFYVTANNLYVFTKYSGYDPDVNVRQASPITPGVDYSAYPRSRAYIFGVNLTF